MKNKLLTILAVTGFFLAGSIASKAQVVKTRSVTPVEVNKRPVRPGPSRYYWKDDDWDWQGGTYVLVPGSWVERPGGGRWKKGHWSHVRGGEVWHQGHWR